MAEDQGPTQFIGNRANDWGLAASRNGDDPAATALLVSHRFGMPTIAPGRDATMIYSLLRITVTERANGGQYIPLNLCLVLDQSLSMRGEKMERVKDAARYVIEKLGPNDTLSVVSFNDRATLVVAAQPVHNHLELKDHVDGIVPRGGTELAKGITMGLDQLRVRAQQRNTVSALLVLTDGRTYGDDATCLELAERARRQQILITPLGVGEEWNEDLLEAMAYRSGSHSEYIDQPSAIVTAFQTHIEALQATFGRNTRLIVQTPENVRLAQLHRVSPLLGRVEVVPGAGTDAQTFSLGNLHAGEEQEFLLDLVAQRPPPGRVQLADIRVVYEPAIGLGQARVPYDLAILAEDGGTPSLDPAVKTAVEKVVAYKLQQKAWQDVNEGNVVVATHRLRMVATRLIAAGEEELARTVQAEADHLERTGQTSATGTKQIKYGTRGLGRTQAMRPGSRLLGREKTP
jgi:Mg-chelatase subunit ChlD